MYVCMYIYVCLNVHTYIYTYTHIYTLIYTYINTNVYIHTSINTYIHAFLHRHHTYALNTTHYVQDITYIACESTCRVRSYHILRYIKDIKGLMLSNTKQQHTQPFITKIVICEIKKLQIWKFLYTVSKDDSDLVTYTCINVYIYIIYSKILTNIYKYKVI